jgi:hypothetical protein
MYNLTDFGCYIHGMFGLMVWGNAPSSRLALQKLMADYFEHSQLAYPLR